ncbi:hypothetical protein AMK22_03750 [Streptomyces sp. CB01580]|nr:hypothetical protein AMK22_03750 [Streptomyces sp. CB01580]
MDSLMPTMRSYEPSTASITDGDGMIAVAIRFTGPAGVKAPAPMPRRAVRRDGAEGTWKAADMVHLRNKLLRHA